MFNQSSGISSKSRHGTANVAVEFEYLLDGAWQEKRRSDTLLGSQNNTLGRLYAHCGTSKLNSVSRVVEVGVH